MVILLFDELKYLPRTCRQLKVDSLYSEFSHVFWLPSATLVTVHITEICIPYLVSFACSHISFFSAVVCLILYVCEQCSRNVN